jgi:hypothetical protein
MSSNNYHLGLINLLNKLFTNCYNKIMCDIGIDNGDYTVNAGLNGWTVFSFEKNYDNYTSLSKKINHYQLEDTITPIYVNTDIDVSIDFFTHGHIIGLVKINTNGSEMNILNNLKNTIQNNLVDNLIIHVYPNKIPTIFWMDMLIYLHNQGYHIYDLKHVCENMNNPTNITPYDIKNIHIMSNGELLFTKSIHELMK